MAKYRACKRFDETLMSESYWVEKTDERYGYPAVLIPMQPRFFTYQDAVDYAKKLNGENEQLKLF